MTEERRPDGAGRSPAYTVAIVVVGVYLLFFLAMVLDELVFHTMWLSRYSGSTTKRLIEFIYWPLIEIVKRLR